MKRILIVFSILAISCAKKEETVEPNLLDKILASKQQAITNVMNNLNAHEVQIIYTEIIKEGDSTQLLDHTFQLNKDNYFYPASTVKLPVAVLAMEFLSEQTQIDANTPYVSTHDTLVHTIEDDLRQIFAVSDNEAYNRLYELLGRDYINKKLNEKDLDALIQHRLETDDPSEAKREGLHFIIDNDTLTIGAGVDRAVIKRKGEKLQKGKGYIKNGVLINEPMNFSEKNYFPLEAQNGLLKRLFFPEHFSSSELFSLSEENKAILLKHMHTVPRMNGYNEATVYDSFGKIFLFGDSKGRFPGGFKYYNKIGYAYGTLIDNAYIVDSRNNIEFLLSATIITNKNEIFNDDIYEYAEIGIPFIAELGREIYQYELKKKR